MRIDYILIPNILPCQNCMQGYCSVKEYLLQSLTNTERRDQNIKLLEFKKCIESNCGRIRENLDKED